MKNLTLYHLITLLPIIVILSFYAYEAIDTLTFTVLFFIYAFVYRPVFDFKRLKALDLVNDNDWRKFIGLGKIRFKFYSQLMFGKD